MTHWSLASKPSFRGGYALIKSQTRLGSLSKSQTPLALGLVSSHIYLFPVSGNPLSVIQKQIRTDRKYSDFFTRIFVNSIYLPVTGKNIAIGVTSHQ